MIGCVVLNWNGWRDTLACLESLQHQTHQPLHVIVVDNKSTDDSVDRILAFIAANTSPTRFTLIQNDSNAGFAKGCNLGIRPALQLGCSYIWMLNNDTVCPPDTLEKLIRTAEQDPAIGMAGTVLHYFHNPSQIQAWGGGHISRFTGVSRHYTAPTPLTRGSYLTFASVLIRAQVFADLGLLYEGAFMYYEDADYALRLEASPWKLAIAPDTAVLHKEGGSAHPDRSATLEGAIAFAGLKFLRRHSPVPLLSIPVFLLLKLGNRALRGRRSAFTAVWKAFQTYRNQGV